MSASDRVFKCPMLDHQSDGVFEIGVSGFAALESAPPELAFGIAAAAKGEYDRQSNLTLAKIIADILSEPRRHAAIVECVVDQLEGDAQIHSERAARRLLRLLSS